MGRHVIYFNPHGEVKKTLTEDKTGAVNFASSQDELCNNLSMVINKGQHANKAAKEFLTLHCGKQDGQVVDRCLIALAAIANKRIVPLA